MLQSTEYSEPSQASKMVLLAKIFNCWKPLIIFAKRSILDVWDGSEDAYANVICHI